MEEVQPRRSKRRRRRANYPRNDDEIAFIDSDGEYSIMTKKKVENPKVQTTEVSSKIASNENNIENDVDSKIIKNGMPVVIEFVEFNPGIGSQESEIDFIQANEYGTIEVMNEVWDLNDMTLLHDAAIVSDDPPGEDIEHHPKSLFDFQWRPLCNSLEDKKEPFTGPTPGPTQNLNTPYEAFVAIWDQDIMEYIVEQTNIYARQTHTVSHWDDTNVGELYLYFSILISFSLCVKADLKEYFHKMSDPVDTPNLKKYMSYDRFISLNNYLHFANNENLDVTVTEESARYFKIKPIIRHLNKKFQELYKLNRDISIVESLINHKNNIKIPDNNENLTASESLKGFELCDLISGYLWHFEIYVPENTIQTRTCTSLDPTTRFVLNITDGLQNRGHVLYMDSYFSSPVLARMLKASGIDCIGALRPNCKFVPPQILEACRKNGRDNVPDQTSGDVNIILSKDNRDNRSVIISTYHINDEKRTQNKCIERPAVVQNYMKHLNVLDKRDQVVFTYRSDQGKVRVWYKKVFRHLFNVSLLNSWILYKSVLGDSALSYRSFRYRVVNAICEKYADKIVEPINPEFHKRPDGGTTFPKVIIDHFPREYEISPIDQKTRIRKQCVVCKKTVSTYCKGCQETLCAFTCHISYHSPEKKKQVRFAN